MSRRNKPLPIFLICENLRSAYNVGALFRSADAVGVEKIYLVGTTPTPGNKQVVKTALGSEKNVPWEHHWNMDALLASLQKQNITLIALETTKKAIPYYNLKAAFPMALILGNEPNGIELSTLKKVSQVCVIPMRGKKESLNVAIAGSIVLFELAQKIQGTK